MNMDQAIAAAEVVEAHTEIDVFPEHDTIQPLLDSDPESLLHLGHHVGTTDDPESPKSRIYERFMEHIADAYDEIAAV